MKSQLVGVLVSSFIRSLVMRTVLYVYMIYTHVQMYIYIYIYTYKYIFSAQTYIYIYIDIDYVHICIYIYNIIYAYILLSWNKPVTTGTAVQLGCLGYCERQVAGATALAGLGPWARCAWCVRGSLANRTPINMVYSHGSMVIIYIYIYTYGNIWYNSITMVYIYKYGITIVYTHIYIYIHMV